MKIVTSITATAIALALALTTPITASAQVFTPNGSQPYGANSICGFYGDWETSDPSETTCSSIPTFQWDTSTPTPPVNTTAYAQADWGKFDWVSAVVPEGTLQGNTENDGTYSYLFLVNPTDVKNLPLLGTAQLNVFSTYPEKYLVQGVTAKFITDNTLTSGVPNAPSGSIRNLVPDGHNTPVPTLVANAGQWDAEINLPAPTWVWETNGVANAYGWSGKLETTITVMVDGVMKTYTTQLGFDASTPFMTDIQNFHNEIQLDDGQVGVSTSAYNISVATKVLSVPTNPEPQPEPTPNCDGSEVLPGGKSILQVVEAITDPCEVQPTPEPTTPAPQPEPTQPEPTPGLKVETGDQPEPNWVLLGVAGLLVAGAGGVLLVKRGKDDNQ